MTDDKEVSYLEAMEALRNEYLQSLPGRIEEIETGWEKLIQGKWTKEEIYSLHNAAHRLTGSGGTFGFPEVSTKARAVEQLFRSLADSSPQTPNAAVLQQAKTLIDELKSCQNPTKETQEDFNLPPAWAPETNPFRQEQHTVFLVEDDVETANELSLQLSHFGYSVETYHDLSPALEALEVSEPAAVIMDIVFPEGELAGAKAIAEIQSKRSSPFPVLFISARSDIQARLQAVRAGGAAYLTKPIDISEMTEWLEKAVTETPPEQPRVLIVDDDSALSRYYGLVLNRAGLKTETLHDPLKTLEMISEFKPDLILLDLYMEGCNGIEIALVLRQLPQFESIPIVFLSTEKEINKQRTALQRGADAFLIKPIQPETLISEVLPRAERARRLHSLLARDGLTGLLNHSFFKTRLEQELIRAERMNNTASLAMIDLDHFKSINDQIGHAAGDRVLKNFALLLRRRLRQSDVIGRFGGEEFVVFLPNTGLDGAQKLIDEIRRSWEAVKVGDLDIKQPLTFSAGIASFSDYKKPEDLLEAADKALYQAKDTGRNKIHIAGITG